MRISDWSSDVCSSDLPLSDGDALSRGAPRRRPGGQIPQPPSGGAVFMSDDLTLHAHLIGRQGSRADLNTPVLVIDQGALDRNIATMARSEEKTSELQSIKRISYAVFCLKKTKQNENK